MMIQAQTQRSRGWLGLARGVLLFDTIAVLAAAAMHINGVDISLGTASFTERAILPAAIVEGAVGLLFLLATVATFRHWQRAWVTALVAHLFAIAGFALGIAVIAFGNGPNTTFNNDFHRVMMAVFLAGLVLLFVPAVRAAFASDAASR